MKKTISLILALMLFLSLCACGGSTAEIPESTPEPTSEPTPTPEPTPEPQSWELAYAVDDFGDPTDDVYLRGIFSGTFSNTATAESELTAVVFWEPVYGSITSGNSSTFSFRLLEYGDHKATYYDSDDIVIKVKVGEDIYSDTLLGFEPNGDLLLYSLPHNTLVFSECYNAIWDTLYEGIDVRCIIEIGNSQYNFTIDSTGFSEGSDTLRAQYLEKKNNS